MYKTCCACSTGMGWMRVSKPQPIPIPICTHGIYPHGVVFPNQNMPKNVQNGPEMEEIYPIQMNFIELAVSPSVLLQKICFWSCSKSHRYGFHDPYPYLRLPIPVHLHGIPQPVLFPTHIRLVGVIPLPFLDNRAFIISHADKGAAPPWPALFHVSAGSLTVQHPLVPP